MRHPAKSLYLGLGAVGFVYLLSAPGFAAPPAEASLEEMRARHALHGMDQGLKRRFAESLVAKGHELMASGKYAEAASLLDEAVELYPEAGALRVARANALFLQKKYDAARGELDAARRLGEEGFHYLNLLGLVLYEEGEIAEAVSAWERALAAGGSDAERTQMAKALEKGRRELALQQRMLRGESGRFVLSYDSAAVPQLAGEVLDALEDAYVSIGYDLMRYPEAKVPVILYTERDYRSVTQSPDWSGGVYDGKIRIPVKGAATLDDTLRSVLRHEFVHVLVAELTKGNCPTWLNEGLAEVEGRKAFSSFPRRHPLHRGMIVPASGLASGFGAMQGPQAGAAYEQSFSMVSYLVDTHGWVAIRELLEKLGEGVPFQNAFDATYGGYGVDFTSFMKSWEETVAVLEKSS